MRKIEEKRRSSINALSSSLPLVEKTRQRRKQRKKRNGENEREEGEGRHELNWKKELITRTTVYRHWLIPLVAATFGEVSRERRRS